MPEPADPIEDPVSGGSGGRCCTPGGRLTHGPNQMATAEELYWVEKDLAIQVLLQEPIRERLAAATRESQATILKLRLTGPMYLSKSGEWKYQSAVHSQTLEGLPERLDRLSFGSLRHSHQAGSTRVVFSQPTLTIPPKWDQSTQVVSSPSLVVAQLKMEPIPPWRTRSTVGGIRATSPPPSCSMHSSPGPQ